MEETNPTFFARHPIFVAVLAGSSFVSLLFLLAAKHIIDPPHLWPRKLWFRGLLFPVHLFLIRVCLVAPASISDFFSPEPMETALELFCYVAYPVFKFELLVLLIHFSFRVSCYYSVDAEDRKQYESGLGRHLLFLDSWVNWPYSFVWAWGNQRTVQSVKMNSQAKDNSYNY